MKKLNFRYLFYPFLIFLLGANIVRYIFAGDLEYIIITSILLALLIGYCLIKKHLKQMLVLLLCFAIGCGWYFLGMAQSFNSKEYVGKVAVVGRISDSISEEKYSYKVVLDSVKIDGQKSSNVSVEITNCYENLEVGSFISFESELENVHAFTLGDFNTASYRNGVRYQAKCNFKYAVVSEGYQTLDEQVRLSIKTMLYENMSDVNAETAYASLFGDKSNVDSEVYSSYQGSGIIHILTVSGLHVSFLISLIFGLLKKCNVNKYVNFALTTIFIFFYAYLCNFTPSVLRAGIMGIIFMLSKLMQRRYDSLNALGVAGFLICLFKPLSALDTGFLMSVFCVVGINFLMPLVQRLLSKIMPKGASDTMALSLSAQIGIFPLLCLMGGSVNVLSILTNFIVVPIFAVVFPLLFVICFLGLLLPFISKLLIVIDYAFTFIGMVATFFNVEQTKIYLKNMGFVNILLFYVASFVVSDYLILLGKQKLIVMSVVLLCFTFACVGYYFNVDKLSTISYISQYGKSSVVLKSKSGQTLVIGDCFLLEKLAEKCHAKYNIFLSNGNVSDYRYDALTELGFSSFISYEEGVFSENNLLEIDKDYLIGDFKTTYLSSGDKLAGVRVNFDNLEIFIASSENIGYNEFEKISNIYNFDLVVADYTAPEGDFIHVAKKHVEGVDYTFNAIGNMAFDGDNLTLRRLD